MNKTLLIAPLTLATALSMAGCASESGAGAETDDITGLWRMTSLEVGTEGDLEEIPYTGQIAFTDDTVSVQAMNPDAAAEDTEFTLGGYEAFYGDANIDADAGTFSVDVESSAARGLIGQTLKRNFTLTDDVLVLTPIDPADGFRVTYKRQED